MLTITDAHLRQYMRDGVFVARSLEILSLTHEVKSQFRRLIEAVLMRELSPSGSSSSEDDDGDDALHKQMSALFNLSQPKYLSCLRQASKLAAINKLFLTEPILTIASRLGVTMPALCEQPSFHVNSDLCRFEGGYQGFPAHQDWPSIQGSLDSIVVWIPFTTINRRSFPLEVSRGSHLAGILPSVIEKNTSTISESYIDPSSFEPIEVSPGDVVFMSTWLVHRTAVTGCSGLRLAASARFDNCLETTFVRRNFPSAYIRTVHRELLYPGFPSDTDISETFKKLMVQQSE